MKKPDVKDFIGQSFKEYSIALDVYIDQVESQLKEVEKLNSAFPDGLGDYEWKIIENFNSKNFRISELEAEKKELIESIESLLVLVDAKLSSLDGHAIENDKKHIWNKVVKIAQDLINKLKQ